MAQSFWTADDYAIGDDPIALGDWTIINGSIPTSTIGDFSSGTKYWELHGENDSRQVVRPVGGIESTTDQVEIYALLTGTGFQPTHGVEILNTNQDGYSYRNGSRDGEIKFVRLDGGSETSITSVSPKNLGFQVRMRADNGQLKVKRWDTGGATEPATWDIETTDTTHEAIFAALVVKFRGLRVVKVGIGTDGDSAPTEAAEQEETYSFSGSAAPSGTLVEILDGSTVLASTTESGGSWSTSFDELPSQLPGTVTVRASASGHITEEQTVSLDPATTSYTGINFVLGLNKIFDTSATPTATGVTFDFAVATLQAIPTTVDVGQSIMLSIDEDRPGATVTYFANDVELSAVTGGNGYQHEWVTDTTGSYTVRAEITDAGSRQHRTQSVNLTVDTPS